MSRLVNNIFEGQKCFCSFRELRVIAFAFTAAFLALCSSGAYALDVDADDYPAGALPAGTNLALLYSQFVNRDAVFSGGHWAGNGTLNSEVNILRYAHFVDIGPFIADPQFLLPFGHLQATGDLGSLGEATGVGDLILAATVWLYRNTEAGYFFGITPILYVPIGTYDQSAALNLGENRWKGAVQAGWVMPLFTQGLSLQLTADVTFYGHNNDVGIAARTLSARPMIELQSWVKYAVNTDLDVRLGFAYFNGGETYLDGLANNDRTSTMNFKVGAGWNFAPTWNILAVYGRDISVQNGTREANRVNLRLLKAF